LGEIADRETIKRKYADAHIIAVASSREGMPLVIMEAMSYGTVPISTSVGGIPFVIKNNNNGFLISDNEEARIVDQMVSQIIYLQNNRQELKRVSRNCTNYVNANYSDQHFKQSYRNLLN
jgi:glycosyltransferase involved in cell wall biosynthesis